MTRTQLTDGSGKWFDSGTAVRFRENTRWNGNNHISVNTGSQWNHESVYWTATKRWIKNCWSNYQGSLKTYEEISEEEAIQWLSFNECEGDEEFKQLPESIRMAVQQGIESLEV